MDILREEINEILRLAGMPPLKEASTDELESYSQLDDETTRDLVERGFNVTPGEELFHGTDQEFDEFDMKFNRTASHIYTAPDPMTASGYGENIYLVAGRTDPHADLTEDYQLIRKVAEEIKNDFMDDAKMDEDLNKLFDNVVRKIAMELAIKNSPEDPDDALDWYMDEVSWSRGYIDPEYENHPEYQKFEAALNEQAIREAAEFITSGKIYEYDYRGAYQDQIMDLLFGWGYNSIAFMDPATSGGGEPISVVFDDPNNLVILGQYSKFG